MHVQDDLTPTRQSLLERLKDASDDESWRRFFETYWRLIYFTGLKAGLSEVEAQDLVQETVISVFRSRERFQYARQNGSFKKWLLQLTHWRIIDQLRKRQKRLARLNRHGKPGSSHTKLMEQIPEPPSLNLTATWDQEWIDNLMQAAVETVKKKVNPKHWQIFDLYTFQEWPIRRITAALGVSAARVYLVKHRLRKMLRKELEEHDKNPRM